MLRFIAPALLLSPLMLALSSCGGDSSGEGGSIGDSDDDGSGSGQDDDDFILGGDGTGGPNSGPGGELIINGCAGVSQEAENASRPVDVIFVIDNSSSMDGEIRQVEQRINEDFAAIIEENNVDYRVIMVSRYGDVEESVGESDHPICIGGTLGGQDCADPESARPTPTARFFHYSADIRSREPWCRLLEGWDNPDELAEGNDRQWTPLAPNGWGAFLREGAFKSFVVISDDDSRCGVDAPDYNQYRDVAGQPFSYSFDDEQNDPNEGASNQAAEAFDEALLALSPLHFGTSAERNYRWYSIIGMAENNPPTEPWDPGAPLQFETCSQQESEGVGGGFQALSRLTGGLRYPSCRNDDFDAIFRAIAQGVVRGALSCEWAIPNAPAGQSFDRQKVNVQYTPGNGNPAELLSYVNSPDNCMAGGWHYDDLNDPSSVVACPQTCDVLQADDQARVDVVFGCNTEVHLQ